MRDFLRRFLRNRGAVAGAVFLILVVLMAAAAPLVYPASPWDMAGAPFQPPGQRGFLLGSDMLGRDVASGIMHGAIVSLLIGLVSASVAVTIGVTLGGISGYYGGRIDDALMRITEFFQTIPNFVLLIVLVALFTPSVVSIIIAIGVVSWPPVARIVRGEFLSIRSREFVQAAILMGESDLRIMFFQVLPNALSPVIVAGSLLVATAILLESALSFLGLGDPNLMSWGYMIGAARTVMRRAWWMSLFPGLAIVLTVLALNLLGDGLNDALNPRLARERPRVTDTVLAIEGLTVALPEGADRPHAVEDLFLTVGRDEIVCIVGESGSGKSVTALTILGLLPRKDLHATAGAIRYGGQNLLQLPAPALRKLRGARISMIFQEPMAALNPVLTIGDQIGETIRAHETVRTPELNDRIERLLASVNLPDPPLLRRVHPHRLSGGQRQRVMIAMALALSPDLLIADEPTTALDVTTQAQILRLLKEIQAQRHMGILFITHDFGVVVEIADRVAVMRQGRLVEQGPTRQVLDAPQHPYTRSLIAAVPRLSAKRAPPPADAETVLRITGLAKTYVSARSLFRPARRVIAVDGVDLTIRRGETLGIVGESGSGKSTLARLIVRLLRPDAGVISFHGTDLRPLSRRALRPYRKKIQMVFQDPFGSLNPRWRVGDIIAAGPVAQGTTRAAALTRAAELLELVGLDATSIRRFPHEFSGGQRQRIGIARALALEPELLIADEPVSALDVSVQAQVLDLLERIRRRLNLAMLLITHDLRVAAQVCDTVAVMRHGRVVEYAPAADLFEHPQHAYTQELIASIPGRNWSALLSP